MKKILISVDCTPFSNDVAAVGKKIAANNPDAAIILLHILLQPSNYTSGQYSPILGYNLGYNTTVGDIIDSDRLENAVHDFLTELKENQGLTNAEVMVVKGDPDLDLNPIAREQGADIIVLGRQNTSAGFKGRIGHVVKSIIEQAEIPIVIVPGVKAEE